MRRPCCSTLFALVGVVIGFSLGVALVSFFGALLTVVLRLVHRRWLRARGHRSLVHDETSGERERERRNEEEATHFLPLAFSSFFSAFSSFFSAVSFALSAFFSCLSAPSFFSSAFTC